MNRALVLVGAFVLTLGFLSLKYDRYSWTEETPARITIPSPTTDQFPGFVPDQPSFEEEKFSSFTPLPSPVEDKPLPPSLVFDEPTPPLQPAPSPEATREIPCDLSWAAVGAGWLLLLLGVRARAAPVRPPERAGRIAERPAALSGKAAGMKRIWRLTKRTLGLLLLGGAALRAFIPLERWRYGRGHEPDWTGTAIQALTLAALGLALLYWSRRSQGVGSS